VSYEATLHFKSGRVHGQQAPRSVDPEGAFTFGRAFPHLIEQMDRSARELGVAEPSRFVWHDPMHDEGGLDKLSAEAFEALQRKHDATKFWVPLDEGIRTFAALAGRHELRPEYGTLTDLEHALAFEGVCFHAALREAAETGEEAFHIQCY
jgi:hypothetical protein